MGSLAPIVVVVTAFAFFFGVFRASAASAAAVERDCATPQIDNERESQGQMTSPQRVTVFTDMEPDDIMAVYMVAADRQTAHVFQIVAGRENDVVDALGVAQMLATALRSDFGAQVSVVDAAAPDVVQQVRSFAPDVVYLQKPPREYFALLPSDAVPQPNTRVLMYGSFNVRKLRPDHASALAGLRAEFPGEFAYVESFDALGQNNAATVEKDFALFYAMAASRTHTMALLRAQMMLWNVHIANDCRRTLTEVLKPEFTQQLPAEVTTDHVANAENLGKAQRNLKILRSLQQGGIATQFVMADVLLPVVGKVENAGWCAPRALQGFDGKDKYPVWGDVVPSDASALIFNVVTRDESAWPERRAAVVRSMLHALDAGEGGA